MTVRRQWRFPEGLFSGPDQAPERRSMEDLAKHLNMPLIGMARDTTFAVTTAAQVLPFPTTLADTYSLYRSATNTIQVPQDYTQYLVIGMVSIVTDALGGTGRRLLAWRVNGGTTRFRQSIFAGAPSVAITAPIMKSVKKGDALDITVLSFAAETLQVAELWAIFVPLN